MLCSMDVSHLSATVEDDFPGSKIRSKVVSAAGWRHKSNLTSSFGIRGSASDQLSIEVSSPSFTALSYTVL
jgi:hypothetical protein